METDTKPYDIFTFLNSLSIAAVVRLDGKQLVISWSMDKMRGRPDNEVVYFSWLKDGVGYGITLTEEGILKGEFVLTSDGQRAFRCEDSEGDMVSIEAYALAPIYQSLP